MEEVEFNSKITQLYSEESIIEIEKEKNSEINMTQSFISVIELEDLYG